MSKSSLVSKSAVFGIAVLFVGASFSTMSSTVSVIPTATAINVTENDRQPMITPLITFESVLEMDYDEERLNQSVFQPDGVSVIPLTIRYKIDVPELLLRPPLMWLKRWFLFGKTYHPFQEFNLLVLNEPDWAIITLTNPRPGVEFDNEFMETTTSIVVMLYHDAPAFSYNLHLKAEAPALGRIEEDEDYCDLVFSIEYMPGLSVCVDPFFVFTPPNQITNVSVNITNFGNYLTLVSLEVITELEGWAISFNQSQVIIPVDETKQVTLQLMPPEDFQGNQSIELQSTPTRYPPRGPEDIGTPHSFWVTAYYPEPPQG